MTEGQGRVTLWGIEVFLAVTEEGAISAAARRLGVSPSAISQQLTGLEAALGAVLLDRSARPMGLTPAGAMFRRHAQTILNAEAEARSELAMADLSGLTTLRLGVIEDFDAQVTPLLLQGLASDLKGCRFLLETGASHRLLDQLEARALDMVVAADLDSEVTHEGWREVHPVMAEPFVAVAPRGQDPAQLPLILYTARHLMGRQIASHLARQNLKLTHRFELDSYRAILAMVSGGAGWTILTPLALHHASRFREGIDVMPLPFAPFGRTLSLSARAGVLRDIPAQVADRMRGLIAAQVVAPARQEWPWMAESLRVL
jgi:DNA-binding transcriptional LysR family regulator